MPTDRRDWKKKEINYILHNPSCFHLLCVVNISPSHEDRKEMTQHVHEEFIPKLKTRSSPRACRWLTCFGWQRTLSWNSEKASAKVTRAERRRSFRLQSSFISLSPRHICDVIVQFSLLHKKESRSSWCDFFWISFTKTFRTFYFSSFLLYVVLFASSSLVSQMNLNLKLYSQIHLGLSINFIVSVCCVWNL